MKAFTIPLFAMFASAIFLAPPAVGEAFSFDYTLTYTTSEGATAYSVDGVFAYHPECLAWSASAPTTASTSDLTLKQTYRVSLAAGVIEQKIQRDGVVTTSTLTCPTGATVFLNPINSPPYLTWDNGCGSASVFVRSDSNPVSEAPFTSFHTQTTNLPLWQRQTTCVGTKAGTSAAPTPFTGMVESRYFSCHPSGCQFGITGDYGRVCTPMMLGGIPIGTAPNRETCTWKEHPQSQPEYRWNLAALDMTGKDFAGISSWGGYWITSAF